MRGVGVDDSSCGLSLFRPPTIFLPYLRTPCPSLQREEVRKAETAKAGMAADLQEVKAELEASKQETAAARVRLSAQA